MKSEKQCKNKINSFILFNKEIENIKRTKQNFGAEEYND